MALFELARGLAGAYNGFNEGIDAEKNRQRAEVDRKYQDEQRAYQQQQQQRIAADQQRSDKLRTDLSAIDSTGPKDAAYSAASRAYGAAGDFEKSWAAQEAAIKSAYGESAKGYQRLLAASPGMDAKSAAEAVVSQLNSDYLPTKVVGYAVDPSDGSIEMEIDIGKGGQRAKHKFKSKEELLRGMEAIYSPDTYNSFVKAQREALIKQQEEINKPRIVGPGATLVSGGKPVYQNDAGYIPDPEGRLSPDGSGVAMIRAPSSGRGAGSGSSTGGKATAAPINDAHKYLEDALGKPDGSPEMAQRNMRAVSMLEGIYSTNPNISPRTAAYIAADATADEATGKPTKVTPQLNKDTGEVEMVYRNPQVEGGKPFRVATGGSAADLEKVGGKQQVAESVKGMVAELVSKAPPAQREAAMSQLVFVAKNPEQREKFIKQAASRGEDVAAWDRQLNLIRDYISLPGEKQIKSDGPLDKLRNVGGIFQRPSASQGAGAQEYVPRDGVPAELASRVSSASAAEQKRNEEDAAKKSAEEKAKAESRQKKRQEIGWLTQREISVMRPSEAGEYLRKYQDVLEPELARALRRRM